MPTVLKQESVAPDEKPRRKLPPALEFFANRQTPFFTKEEGRQFMEELRFFDSFRLGPSDEGK